MEYKICPYCKERIEFVEGECKVCAIRNHLWECKKHRQLNRAKENLFKAYDKGYQKTINNQDN